MRPLELWKSTPFKIAILNAVTSALLIILTALILYHNFHALSRARLKHLLEDEYAFLEDSYATGGLPGLQSELNDEISAYANANRVYAVVSPGGGIIAGNARKVPDFKGFATLKPGSLGLTTSDNYMGLSRRLGDFKVVIAVENVFFDEISYDLYSTLLSVSFAIGIVSLIIGGVIGAGAASRLRGMAQSIDQFAKGDMATRIPVSGAGDDIDMLARQVNQKLDRIQELMTAFREIGADIAHDLKTPLSRLYLDLQTLAADCERDSDFRERLEGAVEQTESIGAMFEAILMLASLENSPKVAQAERIDLNALCQDLAETYEAIAADKNQSLTLRCSGTPQACVEGDRKLLAQMIVNLIENAIRHTPEGSSIGIDIAQNEENGAVLTIYDNGPGIPAEEREKVFRRFYRAEQSRTTPGSGLGMTLVHAIADKHHARIELDSANPGLIVRIRFPAPAS